ncbi:sigma factor-like helix-turn-helix DNA-binding protein [Actinacidiphila glaucinigra]|uniref:sigma factor-like helix-turn-helix DNA-binding protein n=1 Tax=Actinacidiphila glaucinigra TaxID=235986 RepID=UPI0036AC261E
MAVSGCTAESLDSALDPDDEDNGALADVFVPPTPPSKAWRPSRPPAGHRRPRPTRPVPAADTVRQERTQSHTGDALGVSQMHVSRLLNRLLARLRSRLDADDA